jgi:signal transduction histidine kinase
VNEALQLITRESCTLMEARTCSLLMLDESGQWLDLRASHGAGPAYLRKPRLNVDESFMGIVVRRKKPMQLENVQASSLYQNIDMARREGLVSVLSAPLVFGGQSIGTLNVYTGEPRSYSNEEINTLTALAELSAIALEKARLYERVVDVEEQLRQNEKLSALGLLAAEVAHEIRNPLTVMKMLYHSLGLEFSAGDPRIKDDAILREKMDHLNKIVDQILDFARSTEPKLSLVNINQLLDDMALLIRHKLRNQEIHFLRRLAPDLPEIMADPTQLAQAFLNLTLNAVEAMPKGGILTISSRAVRLGRGSQEPSQVLIEFRDTGEGMPEEQRRRSFSSLLSTTKQRGTGLGLAIVGRVVETHRGKVRIRSRPGKGTAILISLPI